MLIISLPIQKKFLPLYSKSLLQYVGQNSYAIALLNHSYGRRLWPYATCDDGISISAWDYELDRAFRSLALTMFVSACPYLSVCHSLSADRNMQWLLTISCPANIFIIHIYMTKKNEI